MQILDTSKKRLCDFLYTTDVKFALVSLYVVRIVVKKGEEQEITIGCSRYYFIQMSVFVLFVFNYGTEDALIGGRQCFDGRCGTCLSPIVLGIVQSLAFAVDWS